LVPDIWELVATSDSGSERGSQLELAPMFPSANVIPATQVADQSDDVFRYESVELATRLTLIHKEGRNARCPRVLMDERG
jgi:hypothetical protein